MANTEKSYRQRFLEFRSGVCPYCGEKTKEKVILTEKGERHHTYHGKCQSCGAENNFTNQKCEEWYDGYVMWRQHNGEE